jgi:hypothetical protein
LDGLEERAGFREDEHGKFRVAEVSSLRAERLPKGVPVVETHVRRDVFLPREFQSERFEHLPERPVMDRFGVGEDPVEIEDHRLRSGEEKRIHRGASWSIPKGIYPGTAPAGHPRLACRWISLKFSPLAADEFFRCGEVSARRAAIFGGIDGG